MNTMDDKSLKNIGHFTGTTKYFSMGVIFKNIVKIFFFEGWWCC